MAETLVERSLRETEESSMLLAAFEDAIFFALSEVKVQARSREFLMNNNTSFFTANLLDDLDYYLDKYGISTCFADNLSKKIENELLEGVYFSSDYDYQKEFYKLFHINENIYPYLLKFFDKIFIRVETLILME